MTLYGTIDQTDYPALTPAEEAGLDYLSHRSRIDMWEITQELRQIRCSGCYPGGTARFAQCDLRDDYPEEHLPA